MPENSELRTLQNVPTVRSQSDARLLLLHHSSALESFVALLGKSMMSLEKSLFTFV